MVDENKGLSYLDAGVNIGAGNELVKRIKPSIKTVSYTHLTLPTILLV